MYGVGRVLFFMLPFMRELFHPMERVNLRRSPSPPDRMIFEYYGYQVSHLQVVNCYSDSVPHGSDSLLSGMILMSTSAWSLV